MKKKHIGKYAGQLLENTLEFIINLPNNFLVISGINLDEN